MPVESLATAGALSDLLVGTAIDYDPLIAEAEYAATLALEFNYVTPGNEMKWGSLQPVDHENWDFARADALVDFAREHDLEIRGHTLVWHSQLPAWVTTALTAYQLDHRLKRHIEKVVRRYRHKIRAWDVVNEAIADDGSMRDTIFLQKLGPDYIAKAFRRANAADHNALLYYNDYNIDTINPKSDAVYALVSQLLDDHVPIDGVGFQMHIDARSAPSTEDIIANFQRFADLGLKVNISELDVRIADIPGDRPTRFAIQKQIYHRVAAACLAVEACESFTTWGFTDRHSWIDFTFGPDDPLEYDELYQRKPAYFGIIDGLVDLPADPVGTAPNLLPNTSFEVGTDGWTVWAGTLGLAEDVAHTGVRSVAVTDRTDSWQGPVHDVRGLVAAGKRYAVSAWVSIDAGTDAVRISAKRRCAAGTDEFLTLGSGTATAGTWTQVTGTLALTACTLESLELYVEGPAAGVTLYADDLELRPLPPELGPNLIANPDFEAGTTGWFGFGGPTITTTTAEPHGGAQSGHASNRTATWQGPAYSVLSAASRGGVYQATGWVRLEGAASAGVNLTLKAHCTSGTDQFIHIGSATANDAGWTQLSGAVTVPDCALDELTFYVEGPAAGVNILLDDMSMRQDLSTVGPNLVANSGFETDASGWFGFGGPTVTSTAALAYSGARSGLATNRTATWQGPAYSLTGLATAGSSYQATAWARLDSGAATEVRMTLKTQCDGVDAFAMVAGRTASSTAWVPFAGTLTVPACATGLTEVTLYFEGPEAGVGIYLDDVGVRGALVTGPVNLIGNPDFETGTSGWVAWGGATIASTTAQAHGGTRSAVVSNRTGTWQGPVYNLLPSVTGGASYDVTFWTRVGGVASAFAAITVKHVCSDGTEAFNQLGSGTATDASWTELTGTLVVPTCTLTELSLYVEGPPVGADVYIDDVVVLPP